MKLYLNLPNEDELWPNAIVDARVSTISMDVLKLPMQCVGDQDSMLERLIFVANKNGEAALPDCDATIRSSKNSSVLGDVLCRLVEGEDWAREICYILYSTRIDTAKFFWIERGKIGKKFRTRSFELIIFKMPKVKTLWQLLERYRKVKKICRK